MMHQRRCEVCQRAEDLLDPTVGLGNICTRCLLESQPERGDDDWSEDPPTLTEEVRRAMDDEENAFGRYVRLRKLGSGGTGDVYLAWDLKLGRNAALKVMRAAGGAGLARLKREAHVLAGLKHPNIATIYDSGSAHQTVWIAMEFVDGKTLAGMTPSETDSARMIRDAARAVEYAHTLGVIHRDIKPGNIMVDGSFRVFVMDFGLARTPESQKELLTESGATLGTPPFMSPEQAQGLALLDGRTDVYGLGASLYALVCGRPPFVGSSAEVLSKVLKEDPETPRKLKPSCPTDLETIILKCLEKRVDARYATADALADDLERFLNGMPILARPSGVATRLMKAARRNPGASKAIGLLVLMLFGFASWLIVSSIISSVQRRRLLAELEASIASGRWDEAKDVASAGLRSYPSDPEIERILHRARVGKLLNTATSESARFQALVEDLKLAHSARVESESLVEPWTPPSALSRFHQARASESDLRVKLEASLQTLEDQIRAAREMEPHNLTLRELVHGVWIAGFQAADESGDQDLADLLRKSMSRATGEDPATFETRGYLRVELSPPEPDVTARLFVFQEFEDRKIAVPVAPDGTRGTPIVVQPDPVEFVSDEASELEKGKWRERLEQVRAGTSQPLPRTTGFDLPRGALHSGIGLPRGSYLLLLESKRAGEVRYPFRILPPATHAAVISLDPPPIWREPSLHHPFIRIAAGEFIRGRDPLAPNTLGRRDEGTATLPEFFISKFEVTVGQYCEFLNDLMRRSEVEAWKRVPRSFDPLTPFPDWSRSNGRISFSGTWQADWPVVGISALDAEAYAEWLSLRTDPSGWRIRLPTEDEWEKAARGADGRLYPWGNELRRSFCATQRSRSLEQGERSPQPIGMFPADESVYGVRDMAGNVAEWTSSSGVTPKTLVFKGGNCGRSPDFCRAASREHASELGEEGIGIRLVAVPVAGEEK